MDKIRRKFNRSEWKFIDPKVVSSNHLKEKILSQNDAKYYDWFKALVEKLLKENSKLGLRRKFIRNLIMNPTAIWMSDGNIDYLAFHMHPMVYLDYSPKMDVTLQDDEMLIDLDEIIGER